jgi:hypothetical protein
MRSGFVQQGDSKHSEGKNKAIPIAEVVVCDLAQTSGRSCHCFVVGLFPEGAAQMLSNLMQGL